MTTSRAGPLPGAGGPGPGGVRGWVVQDRVPPSADGGKREVFILPLPVRDHFILYCEGELAGRQIRMARLLGEGPASRPPQSPSCPLPRALCSGEAPEQAAGATSRLGLRGGRGGRRTPSVSGRASPLTRQLLEASPRLRSSGGCLRGESSVCMDPEWEGNSSSWGFIMGMRLRQEIGRAHV